MELFSQISIHDLFENGLRHGCFHRHFVQKFASSHYWHDEIVIIVWAKNRKLASCYWKIYQTEIFRFFIVIFSHIKTLIFGLIFGHQGALRNFTKFKKNTCARLSVFCRPQACNYNYIRLKNNFPYSQVFCIIYFLHSKRAKESEDWKFHFYLQDL